ncbi:L-alanine-DL-glutamate epimerase-like enolase superfamily enzyme [Bradyrhizobium japonicum]|uniref:cis-3-hydroxy-L-proline dehydratase n=1 Tax=Bradyrhizobium japonicum TaxID=375 RepID=UPI00339A143D
MSHRISRISGYRVLVPLKEGTYTMSGGRSLDQFDTTIVCIETDSGFAGWGEITPLGATYLPSYAEGARTGIREIAPALLGADPTQLECINELMDTTLRGHPYAKSALDIACWDILGKVAGLPVSTMMGGRFGDRIRLYRSITHGSPEMMANLVKEFRQQGFRHFQLKVGGDADGDIQRIKATSAMVEPGDGLVADANGGWTMNQAARVFRATGDLDVYIEQPCRTYEECLTIRRRFNNPFVLDESIDSVIALQRGIADGAMDCINIKLSKLGGLTRSRVVRDICVQNSISMTIEDTACTDITAAAISHIALSTPEKLRLSVTLANVKIEFRTANGAPQTVDGSAVVSDRPGLGIDPITELLGRPIFQFG